ncbi:MarR family transcriptional regulator [Amylibacter ulvae]|uniref:MarR family transcriptional regulator n=1 Tax=Paramylibacter ulvae TaxID=1651968 RepID=A0ABQ3CZ14_9RHOB|nr:MarR family transcriptional regulator [Amylibacter ulvae]GHA48054.1 MarR family transcriptional regulator [Amylibacter ulvae]
MPDPSEADPIAIALFSEILMAEQMMRARLSKALPKGMELSHFTVLNFLANQSSEKSPAQLARVLHLTKGAMTNTLTKLENYGHIHVRPDWDDARRKRVAISDAGLLARLDAIRAVRPVFDKVMNEVGHEKVRAALPFLRDLRGALD